MYLTCARPRVCNHFFLSYDKILIFFRSTTTKNDNNFEFWLENRLKRLKLFNNNPFPNKCFYHLIKLILYEHTKFKNRFYVEIRQNHLKSSDKRLIFSM